MEPTDSLELGGLTMSGDIAMGGNDVTGLPATPGADNAAAAKTYVDSVAANLRPKGMVVVLADTNQTLSTLPTIDGVGPLSDDDRVLLINQTTGSENGIWEVHTGAWTRPVDFDTGDAASGAHCWVDQGTVYGDTGWVCTTTSGSDTIDTDDLNFEQYSRVPYIAGDGINFSGSIIEVDLAATNPCLEFDGAGDLQLQVDGATLSKGASGVSVDGVPSLWEINAVATSANVTAANLNELTGGGVTTLHTHTITAAESLQAELTAQEALSLGDPIEIGTVANQYRQCRANDGTRVDCMAIVIESGGISATSTGTCIRRGVAPGVIAGATTGDRYYVADAGGLVQGRAAISAGNHIVFCGAAKNATDLEFNPQYISKKAA
jgi:hypothetical protein